MKYSRLSYIVKRINNVDTKQNIFYGVVAYVVFIDIFIFDNDRKAERQMLKDACKKIDRIESRMK